VPGICGQTINCKQNVVGLGGMLQIRSGNAACKGWLFISDHFEYEYRIIFNFLIHMMLITLRMLNYFAIVA
jgi:hypothetical protein